LATSSKALASVSLTLRAPVLARYVGELCPSLAIMAAVPGAAALGLGETEMGVRFLAVAGGLAGLSGLARRLPTAPALQVNEGLAVVALTFLLASLSVAWPLAAGGLPLIDGLFEAVSAVTTTGLSTVGSVEARSTAFLFARAWIQWYGGLLIVVLALALLVGPGAVARRLAGDLDPEDLVGSTRIQARRSAAIYLALSLAGFAALMLAGVGGFDALTHTMTAVSTAGFANYDDSLAGLDNLAAEAILSVLCILGAMSFALHYRIVRGGWRRLWRDERMIGLLAALAAGTALTALAMVLVDGMDWREALHHAPMLAISAQTTTGFESLSVAGLSPAVLLVLVVAMAIGGHAGSTAGGLKIFRLLVLLKLLQVHVLRATVGRHAVLAPTVGGNRVEDADFRNAAGTVALFTVVLMLGWFAFLLYGHEPMAALFDVVSAGFTVGLGAGSVGPDLAAPLKLVLCALMLLGRLEIVAVLVLLYPRSWMTSGASKR
jgi:trk system potassium uptake protein TrkH